MIRLKRLIPLISIVRTFALSSITIWFVWASVGRTAVNRAAVYATLHASSSAIKTAAARVAQATDCTNGCSIPAFDSLSNPINLTYTGTGTAFHPCGPADIQPLLTAATLGPIIQPLIPSPIQGPQGNPGPQGPPGIPGTNATLDLGSLLGLLAQAQRSTVPADVAGAVLPIATANPGRPMWYLGGSYQVTSPVFLSLVQADDARCAVNPHEIVKKPAWPGVATDFSANGVASASVCIVASASTTFKAFSYSTVLR